MTDGHALMKSMAVIDPDLRAEMLAVDKVPPLVTLKAITSLWEDQAAEETVSASLLGVVPLGIPTPAYAAIRGHSLLGRRNRAVMWVDAYKLAFLHETIRFDSLAVRTKQRPSDDKWRQHSLRMFRQGNLVALLMPIRPDSMRVFGNYPPEEFYDLDGVAIKL